MSAVSQMKKELEKKLPKLRDTDKEAVQTNVEMLDGTIDMSESTSCLKI